MNTTKKLHSVLALVAAAALGAPALAQNETPSSHVSCVVAPVEFEAASGESTFLKETGSPDGQRYITLALRQTADPGLFPVTDLLDHIGRVDGTYSTGVLLHTSHGGSDKSIQMESFKDADDAKAKAAAQARLNKYKNAGWDVAGADREIEINQHKNGWWTIYMFDRAITNRGGGLGTDKPLVYIGTCYGSLMIPAYVGKGARVGLGTVNCKTPAQITADIKTVFERMNGRQGQAKRPVSQARKGIANLAANGKENTTLAPSVVVVTAPCPIKRGDKVKYTLDTRCSVGNIPDIVGAPCTIERETWLSDTELEGECMFPPPPGVFAFTLTLKWGNTYSKNNTARLDGNTNPAGKNAHGPAHDDHRSPYNCERCKQFGVRCSGGGDMFCATPPRIGTVFQLCTKQPCLTANVLFLGSCHAQGIRLGPPLMCNECPSCSFYTFPAFTQIVWRGPCLSLPLPNNQRLVGLEMCVQNMCLGLTGRCICLTNALQLKIGN